MPPMISIHTRLGAANGTLSTLLVVSSEGPLVIKHLPRTPTAVEKRRIKDLVRNMTAHDVSQASLDRAARAASLLLEVAS